jgi:CotH kinase protein
MALISSDDHGHKNYYLYRDSRHSGEWALLPWDVDLSWGRNWTGQYFNETIFVDNPLDLYREGRQKARNRLNNLLFQFPDFRQMYLRRLRTIMDELLQPPGTPLQSLIIDRRVRELMDLVDPPQFNPSDALRDEAAWPSWGERRSMREAAQQILKEYLPGRRQFLFKSPRARLYGEPIPAAQSTNVTVEFGAFEPNLPK